MDSKSSRTSGQGVIALPKVGGLHNRYIRVAA